MIMAVVGSKAPAYKDALRRAVKDVKVMVEDGNLFCPIHRKEFIHTKNCEEPGFVIWNLGCPEKGCTKYFSFTVLSPSDT